MHGKEIVRNLVAKARVNPDEVREAALALVQAWGQEIKDQHPFLDNPKDLYDLIVLAVSGVEDDENEGLRQDLVELLSIYFDYTEPTKEEMAALEERVYELFKKEIKNNPSMAEVWGVELSPKDWEEINE